jgi:hypothetical protein
MRGHLYINNIEVELEDNIPFPLSFAITDISDLSKVRGNKSKTVTIPGTAQNRQLFYSIFSLTAEDVTALDFDPTIKAVARYFNGSLLQFNGVAQLNKVVKVGQNMSFELTLFGDVIDFNARMSTVKLNELDWSDTSHVLNQTNIETSWTATSGYYYGLANYGYNPLTPDEFAINEIPPQAYVYEVLDKVANFAGFSIQSSFIGTTFFRNLLLAYAGGELPQLSASQADDESVKAVDNFDRNRFNQSTIVFSTLITTTRRFPTQILSGTIQGTITQDVNGQVVTNDPLAIRVNTAGLFEFQYNGSHDLSVNLDNKNVVTSNINLTFTLNFQIFVNGALIENATIWTETVETGILSNTPFTYTNNIPISYSRGLNLNVNDLVTISVVARQESNTFTTAAILPVFDLNYRIEANTATADLIKLPQEITEGSTINLSSFMPEMTGADFFKGLVSMFNLIVMPSPTDNTKLIIEPFDAFYSGQEDWTQYLDDEQPIEIVPTINFAPKEFQFMFTDDQTQWRNNYFAETGKRYGDRTVASNSQYSKDVTVFQLPFGCPPMVQLTTTNITMPTVTEFDPEANEVKPKRGTAFICYKIGATVGNVRIKTTDFVFYPAIGHTSPTVDLLFQKPDKFYFPVTSYPSNNLFTYHANQISELLSKFGKLVRAKFRLNSDVINRLSLRKFVIVDKTKYRVNSIDNYDAISYENCDVEIIRTNG